MKSMLETFLCGDRVLRWTLRVEAPKGTGETKKGLPVTDRQALPEGIKQTLTKQIAIVAEPASSPQLLP
jgi:hypothetical protein